MSTITRSTSTVELAALVSEALENAGIVAVLSGGGAVSIYTENQYESLDLDFVTSAPIAQLADAIAPLGFVRGDGRHFEHPNTELYLEFPPGPLALGGAIVTDWNQLETSQGVIQILSPTQMVMDRLAAYFHWNDPQSLDQATMIARAHSLEWKPLDQWGANEGETDKYETFKRRLRRPTGP